MKQYVKAEEFKSLVCSKCRHREIGFCEDKMDLSNPENAHWMYACPKYFELNLERYKEVMSHVAEDD